MKKIAVMLAEGFEEGESIFIIDILRRAGMHCDGVSLEGEMVTGSHGISVKADKELGEWIREYDMIVLPGGLPGATNLRDNKLLISYLKEFNESEEKYIGAMCAAPMVLAEAGVAAGKKVTSYPADKYRDMFKDAIYSEDMVVIDKKMITSRGPATTMPFAFEIVDMLGGDSSELKEKMLYNFLIENV